MERLCNTQDAIFAHYGTTFSQWKQHLFPHNQRAYPLRKISPLIMD